MPNAPDMLIAVVIWTLFYLKPTPSFVGEGGAKHSPCFWLPEIFPSTVTTARNSIEHNFWPRPPFDPIIARKDASDFQHLNLCNACAAKSHIRVISFDVLQPQKKKQNVVFHQNGFKRKNGGHFCLLRIAGRHIWSISCPKMVSEVNLVTFSFLSNFYIFRRTLSDLQNQEFIGKRQLIELKLRWHAHAR